MSSGAEAGRLMTFDELVAEIRKRGNRIVLLSAQVAALREAAQAVVSKASWSEGVSVRALMALRDVLSDTAAIEQAAQAPDRSAPIGQDEAERMAKRLMGRRSQDP